jgi:hypothetical protein
MFDMLKSNEQKRKDQVSVSGTSTRPIFRNPTDGKTYIKNSEGKWELAR